MGTGKKLYESNVINKETSLGRVIYTAPESMVKLVKMIKRLSISTTVLSAGVQPFLYPKLVATGSNFALAFAGITCAGVFVSPLILNWFTKRYVLRLYYDDGRDQFTAERLNLINRHVRHTYKTVDVQVPELLGVFTTYTVGPKRMPLFVDVEQVADLKAYKHMLGFDKPIDLRQQQLIEEIERLKRETKQWYLFF